MLWAFDSGCENFQVLLQLHADLLQICLSDLGRELQVLFLHFMARPGFNSRDNTPQTTAKNDEQTAAAQDCKRIPLENMNAGKNSSQ